MAGPGTAYTYDFIRRMLPGDAKRMLEIGCGDGALAARLKADGHEIVALDSDPACVEAARRIGVDARIASWPDFEDGRFDAVLFTRSLHHICDLGAAVRAAFACLAPGGLVVVEDFDAAFAHEPTFEWLRGLAGILQAAGVPVERSDYLSALLASTREADHDLHSAAAIEAALRAASSALETEPAAYFFRYVERMGAEAEAIADALRAHEEDLIRLGSIAPLGRRFVARP